jgi:hypothetical protein
MTPRDFAYWLQGFFELADRDQLSAEQVQVIKEHLALVFDNSSMGENKFPPTSMSCGISGMSGEFRT